MTNNIKRIWVIVQNKLVGLYGDAKQVYNYIKRYMPSKIVPVKLIVRMPALKRVKPVHAALVAALLATAVSFAALPSFAGKKQDNSQALSVKGDVFGKKVNSSDRYLLARVIEGEAANEPMNGKVAVGAVILNRTQSKDFPHDVRKVVYQPLAFEAVANGQYNRPVTQDALKAADLALSGDDPTNGALYYWNPAKSSSEWIWQRPVTMQIGRHVFAK